MAASNASTGSGSIDGIIETDFHHYDRLPAAIRQQIAEAALKLPAGQILGKFRQFEMSATAARASGLPAADPAAQVATFIADFEIGRLSAPSAHTAAWATVLRYHSRRGRRRPLGEPTPAQLRLMARADRRARA